MEREGENGERMRKWRKIHSLHFLILSVFPPPYPFPTSKFVTFCRKGLNMALFSRMSQKKYHTRYEKIILCPSCCEKAPQVVMAWFWQVHVTTLINPCIILTNLYNSSEIQLGQSSRSKKLRSLFLGHFWTKTWSENCFEIMLTSKMA